MSDVYKSRVMKHTLHQPGKLWLLVHRGLTKFYGHREENQVAHFPQLYTALAAQQLLEARDDLVLNDFDLHQRCDDPKDFYPR